MKGPGGTGSYAPAPTRAPPADPPRRGEQEHTIARTDSAADSTGAGSGPTARLDDEDYPVLSMGQAAELLEVQPAFLRSLDVAGVLHPARSAGGQRRYSRRQLAHAARLRVLFDDGHTLAAAAAIVALQDERDTALAERDHARRQRDTARDERDTARARTTEGPGTTPPPTPPSE